MVLTHWPTSNPSRCHWWEFELRYSESIVSYQWHQNIKSSIRTSGHTAYLNWGKEKLRKSVKREKRLKGKNRTKRLNVWPQRQKYLPFLSTLHLPFPEDSVSKSVANKWVTANITEHISKAWCMYHFISSLSNPMKQELYFYSHFTDDKTEA